MSLFYYCCFTDLLGTGIQRSIVYQLGDLINWWHILRVSAVLCSESEASGADISAKVMKARVAEHIVEYIPQLIPSCLMHRMLVIQKSKIQH